MAAAMRYKGGVFITIIFVSIVLSQCPLVYSSPPKSLVFWLGEKQDVKAMKKENEIGVGSATEVEERQVPTGSDPLHHKHIPFTSP